jgi:hypothetical protein
MSQPFDESRSLTALEQDSTIIAAIEMSQSKSTGGKGLSEWKEEHVARFSP